MNHIFFHIDVNSAFLSWTAADRLAHGDPVDLRLIPSIIGGDIEKRHGIVLAKSIPAKKYHITTGEPIVHAQKKCPSLVIVSPDRALYKKNSKMLMDYLKGISPDIEQVSIDECYMDFTPISSAYSSPRAAAEMIKNSIFEKFHFTVNIGISDRKILAKMASDFKKPNLVHTLFSSEIQEKMWPLPVSSLFMCGKSSVDTLKKLEIITIGDLANTSPEILSLHLKSHGRLLWQYANGIDDSHITSLAPEAKGVGNSTTLSKDLADVTELKHILLRLCESVSGRLRKDQLLCSMVSVEIKYYDFTKVSHQSMLPNATNTTDSIYQAAVSLFMELWNHEPVRLLGVRTSKLLDTAAPQQLSLFDSNTQSIQTEKQQLLDHALDNIRNKYGKSSVVRGSLLEAKPKN